MTRLQAATDQRGFALLAVTLVLALLGVAVTEFAFSMRLEASMVRSYKDAVQARHLAEAGVQQAIREIMSESTIQGVDEEGQVVFYRAPAAGTAVAPLPKLARSHVALGAGEFSYRITNEEGRLNLNATTPDRLDKLLTALGLDKQQRDTINDSIQDWRDADDNFRTNGAESDDTYLKLAVPYRARNANLQDVAELLQIKGITPALYWGKDDQPGLADLVTVRGSGIVNLNTAPPLVLKAAGLADAEIGTIIQTRAASPYPQVPGQYGGRRFSVNSNTFRIEAEGAVGGLPRARLVAIVQRTGAQSRGVAASLPIVVYSWRWVPPPARGSTGQ